MATRYAVANGNWSALATWDGGVSLPGVGDDVYANGFTVTLNQNIIVVKISTEICPITSTAGGVFIRTGVITITCNVVAGATTCISDQNSTSTLIVSGNVYGGYSTNANGINAYYLSTTTVTGNVYGGSGSNSHGIVHSYAGLISVIGSVIAGLGGFGAYIISTHIAGTAVVELTGYAEGSEFKNAISSPEIIKAVGIFKNIKAVALMAPFILINPTSPSAWTFQSTTGTDIILYTEDMLGLPVESDVRENIIYAGGAKIGTFAVAPPASVAKNVPTDNTVGTLEMTPADFWSYATRTLTLGGLTAQEVWEYVNRTITSGGITAEQIWNHLLSAILTEGSVGKLLKDLLDVAISTRLAATGYTAPDNANIALIKAQTDKIPDIPADIITELSTSEEDVAKRLQNVATTQIVGEIHAT